MFSRLFSRSTFVATFFYVFAFLLPLDAKANPMPMPMPQLVHQIGINAAQLQIHLRAFLDENPHMISTGVVPNTVIQRGWVARPDTAYFGIRFFEVQAWQPGLPLPYGQPMRVKMELVRPSYDMTNAAGALDQWFRVNWGRDPRLVVNPIELRNLFHFQLEASLRNAFAVASLIRESLYKLYYCQGHPYLYAPGAANLLTYRLWEIQRALNNLRYLLDIAQHSTQLRPFGVGVVGNCFAELYPPFAFDFNGEVGFDGPLEGNDYLMAPPMNGNVQVQVGGVNHGFHSAGYEYNVGAQFQQPGINGPREFVRAPGAGSVQTDEWAAGQVDLNRNQVGVVQQFRQGQGGMIAPRGGNFGGAMGGGQAGFVGQGGRVGGQAGGFQGAPGVGGQGGFGVQGGAMNGGQMGAGVQGGMNGQGGAIDNSYGPQQQGQGQWDNQGQGQQQLQYDGQGNPINNGQGQQQLQYDNQGNPINNGQGQQQLQYDNQGNPINNGQGQQQAQFDNQNLNNNTQNQDVYQDQNAQASDNNQNVDQQSNQGQQAAAGQQTANQGAASQKLPPIQPPPTR